MPKQKDFFRFHDYRDSLFLFGDGHGFYALIMAAMRQADTLNGAKLQAAWPEVFAELQARYNAPGGALTQAELDYVTKEKGVY